MKSLTQEEVIVMYGPQMIEVLRAHDQYLQCQGYSGPEDADLQDDAAENWFRIRRFLAIFDTAAQSPKSN